MFNWTEVLIWEDLKKYNTYGVGGKAHFVVKPHSMEELQETLDYIKKEDLNWYVLGGGSNVILPDEDFDGVILLLNHLNKINIKENRVIVEAGCPLSKFIQVLLDASFTNLAMLFGIPGTVGGAVIGNAGCYNTEIFDALESITYINEEGVLVTKKSEEIKHEYRWTELKGKKIILINATFSLKKGDSKKAREEIQKHLEIRRKTQPLTERNAGSVFGNPPNLSAGKLIEEAGLKGKRIGGAMISEKHANFINNIASAKSSDIIDLIELIKKEVKRLHKIELKLEQIIVKW